MKCFSRAVIGSLISEYPGYSLISDCDSVRDCFLMICVFFKRPVSHWFTGWVYANVIIHLSVGESPGYSPPLRWIITRYCRLWDPVKPIFELGCWQCCFHEKWINLFSIEVLETKRENYFQILSYFPAIYPETVTNNFNDEKDSLISAKKCKRQQFWKLKRSDSSVWNRRLQSTEENKWLRFTKDHKCSKMKNELTSIYCSKMNWLRKFTILNAVSCKTTLCVQTGTCLSI